MEQRPTRVRTTLAVSVIVLLFSLAITALLAQDNNLAAIRQAAEQGHADAQYNLGLMYDRGDGVPENDAEAVKWYRMAAEQGKGHRTAQPRVHVRQWRRCPQRFRARAHVVQHR